MDSGHARPVVSIIVISFNTRRMTLDCLESIAAQTKTPHEVIVVDNASSDGSAEAIAARFPDVELLAETTNHGFAAANNLAARRASGEYVLLLNPDTVVLDGAIDRLVEFARERPEAKIWGGRTYFADGELNRTCCFQRMTLWTIFCRATGIAALFGNHRLVSEAYGGWDMNSVRRVDIVTGCFLLLPRALWRDLGGFNLTYFMYGEEADLCLRARERFGADPLFTPEANIIHHGGASEPVRADKVVRLYTSKMTLIRHHFPAATRSLASFLFSTIPFSRMIALQLIAGLTGMDRARKAASVWSEIWRRRNEWRGGSPDRVGSEVFAPGDC